MIKLYVGVSVAAQHICKSLAPVDLIAIMLLRLTLRGFVHSSCYFEFVFPPLLSVILLHFLTFNLNTSKGNQVINIAVSNDS